MPTWIQALPYPLQLALLIAVGWVTQLQRDTLDYVTEENRILRELLGAKRLRFTDAQRRRLAEKAHRLDRKTRAEVCQIVTPETILRWYRKLVAQKYDSSHKRAVGRPRTPVEIVALVLRVARENPSFGYTRLRDVLKNLRLEVSRSTVKRILDEHGVVPAPERNRTTSWRQFLATTWDNLCAADFFSVEVMTWHGIVRYQVFFVIELATRRVRVAGVSASPDGAWIQQIGRNLTDAFDGFLLGKTHLILDRDPLFTYAFRELLLGSGVKVVRLPAKSPNLNAYAERFVRSIKSECLSRQILFGESGLRHALREYLAYYHSERHHQGHGVDRLLEPDQTAGHAEGPVRCRQRLGGLLRYYYREGQAA